MKYFRMDAEEAAKIQGLLKGLILIAGLGKIQWTLDMLRMKKKK